MFIYCIRHKASGREYIGKTIRSLAQRWQAHRCDAKSGVPSALYNAMRADGIDAFEMQLLAIASSNEELSQLERQFIAERNTRTPRGYNIAAGGQTGPIGNVPSAEVRAARSARMKGHPSWNKGKKLSAERCAQMSAQRKGRLMSAAHAAQIANIHTPEVRRKLRAAQLGKRLTPEQRQQWREVAKRNRPQVVQTKAQWSPEQREQFKKRSADARRLWWATRTPEQLEQIKLQRAETTRKMWATRQRASAS
jgi:group I intron endonuclease